MSNRIKGIKIRYANGEVSDEFPIGALAQNIDYDTQTNTDVKQKIDALEANLQQKIQNIDLTNIIKLGTNDLSIVANNVEDNKASQFCAFAQGDLTTASAYASHAEGCYTTASGDSSHAEGEQVRAEGNNSHAEGYKTTASGDNSHAEGKQTIASGQNSHASGSFTIANHKSQIVFGEYNIEDNHNATAQNRGNYIEIVGNGIASSKKSNARTLDWDGNQWLAGNLKIGGTSYNDEEAEDVATKTYVDRIASQVPEDVATKTYVDNAIAQIPEIPEDIATKTYVDDAVSQIPIITEVKNAIVEINGTGMDIITTSSELTDTILTIVGTEIHITVAS